MRKGIALSRHDSLLSALGNVYALSGRRAEALQILAELEGKARQQHVSPVYLARIDIGLGDKDRAFARLRQASEERSDHLLSLRVDPIYDVLRSDPRFGVLLREIGLTP